jgi:hypothetical protein
MLLALVAISAQHAKPTPSTAPVGMWKYEVSSMQILPNPATQAKLKDPKQANAAKEMISKIRAAATQAQKSMRVVFKATKQLSVLGPKGDVIAAGTWVLDGYTVKLVMVNAREATPHLELSKDKTRIHATISDAGFGSIKTDLVRA